MNHLEIFVSHSTYVGCMFQFLVVVICKKYFFHSFRDFCNILFFINLYFRQCFDGSSPKELRLDHHFLVLGLAQQIVGAMMLHNQIYALHHGHPFLALGLA